MDSIFEFWKCDTKEGSSLQKLVRDLSNLKLFTKKEEEESVEEIQTTEEFDRQANV